MGLQFSLITVQVYEIFTNKKLKFKQKVKFWRENYNLKTVKKKN